MVSVGCQEHGIAIRGGFEARKNLLVEASDVSCIAGLDELVEVIELLGTPEHRDEVNLGVVVQNGRLVRRPSVNTVRTLIRYHSGARYLKTYAETLPTIQLASSLSLGLAQAIPTLPPPLAGVDGGGAGAGAGAGSGEGAGAGADC